MRSVKVVGDSFAIMDNDEVIGVVTKTNETQWGFFTLAKGDGFGLNYVPLQHALEAALKFKRNV